MTRSPFSFCIKVAIGDFIENDIGESKNRRNGITEVTEIPIMTYVNTASVKRT